MKPGGSLFGPRATACLGKQMCLPVLVAVEQGSSSFRYELFVYVCKALK